MAVVWCLKTHLGEMLLWICCEFRLPAQNKKQGLGAKCLGDVLGCAYELVGVENLLKRREALLAWMTIYSCFLQ